MLFYGLPTCASNYLWRFGDSTTSTDTNPTHTFTNPGNYTVSLTATGPGGTSQLTRTNFITVSLQILFERLVGTDFTFSIQTNTNQSYTIQQNAALATTNWLSYTNFFGNGSLFQFVAPLANIPQRFFRVSQP